MSEGAQSRDRAPLRARQGTAEPAGRQDTGDRARRAADLVGAAPGDARHRDTYVCFELSVGGLYVASSPHAVTGAALAAEVGTPQGFEELHLARTGRTAVAAAAPPRGVRSCLRTGRTRWLRIDVRGLPQPQRAVLAAVRAVPHGQLRPVAWVAREAEVARPDVVLAALAANPVPVLIPSHRITYDDAVPCDVGYPPGIGVALRAAEGIDMARLAELAGRGLLLQGDRATRVYCHPTCVHARRTAPGRQVPFRSVGQAEAAGYRACRSCRPVAA